MKQYIDKSAIVKEIEKRIKEIDEIGTYLSPKGVLTNLLCHLSTLEVKEVDLEKEVRNFLNVNYTSVEEPDEFLTTTMQIDDMTKFAEHFYALGFSNSNPTSQNAQALIEKYISDHADCRWLDASELEQLLNDFVLEYDIIKNREYEQQCKVSNDGNNR